MFQGVIVSEMIGNNQFVKNFWKNDAQAWNDFGLLTRKSSGWHMQAF